MQQIYYNTHTGIRTELYLILSINGGPQPNILSLNPGWDRYSTK